MSSNRHLARVIALQTLYEYEFRTHAGVEGLTADLDSILERNLAVYKETMEDDSFTRDLVLGAHKHQTEADGLIKPAAPEWPLEQIAKMDLAILRLAIYELHIKREVPPKVVINEAVELAKSFGGDNSSRFINGVLGTIYRQSEFYDPTEDHKVQREQQSASSGQKAKTAPQRPAASPEAEVESNDSQPDSGHDDASNDQPEPTSPEK